MTQALKKPPHPSAQLVDQTGRMTREWFDWLSTFVSSSQINAPLTGTATLTATTSVVVSFTTAEANAAYDVYYAMPDDRRVWTTNKGTASFQANSNISTTVTLGWMLMRR